MSERARDVVRYIAAVERGPEHRIFRPSQPPFFEFVGPPTNRDWIRAHNKDIFDPLTNAMAAIRRAEQKRWQTFRSEWRLESG